MRCPYCSQDNDKVIDSRSTEGGLAIRRRRECLGCGKRFTTYEHVEATTRLNVVKRDGSRVPYQRERILAGLEKACFKRPVTAEQLNHLVEEVEEALFKRYDREVESSEIGRVVAERLKSLDQVAYVRFASVYKQFRDLDDFLDEVRDVLEGTPPPEGLGQGKLF
ncbi:MAG: transcriptional repressor NrdR [Phycisphaeraceae bacterium]|nr:transcriptional repressor NrdR [Phycisphaeraceae bacterium]